MQASNSDEASRTTSERNWRVSLTRFSTADGTPPGYLGTLFQRLPPGSILNVGAGPARCPTPGQKVVHVDHVASPGPQTVVVGDATTLPFRGAAFDGVLMKDVLEHLTDCVGALAELRRVVRPGGGLVVQVPRALPRAVWDDPTHVRGFTAHALTQALTLSGWRMVSRPARIGGFPGAARFHLEAWLPTVMRIPGVGHRLGTNWLADAVAG